MPDGNLNTVKAAVASLQSRLQFGAIFVSDKHGEIAGTLPMSLIKAENSGSGRAPDIIVSFSYDERVAVAGKSGISYASSVNRRGDHGSFSPTDTHISLLASGPDFKSGFYDTLPTANVDIAPTVARILQLSMPAAQGRVLEEALHEGPLITEYAVVNKTHRSSTKTGLSVKLPIDVDGRAINPNVTTYSVELKTKILARNGASYTYFDQAEPFANDGGQSLVATTGIATLNASQGLIGSNVCFCARRRRATIALTESAVRGEAAV